jgi:hypothetical protein
MSDLELIQSKRPPKKKEGVVSTRQKILIGGLGALTPVLLSFLVIDVEKVFSKLTLIVCVGYAVRVLLLFYLGGIVAYLHKGEHNALKLFELGIVAPALLTTLVNGLNAAHTEATAPQPQQQEVNRRVMFSMPSFDLVSSAYAQSIPASPEPSEQPQQPNESVKTFSPPQETTTEQLLRGLLGSTSPRVWYVVVGSYSSLENAKRQADAVNGNHSAFSAEVYKSYDTPYYAVVIGANLTLKEATTLKKKALSSHVAKEVYLKRGPDPV